MKPVLSTFGALSGLLAATILAGCAQNRPGPAYNPDDNWLVAGPQAYPRTLSEQRQLPAWPGNATFQVQGDRRDPVQKQYRFDDIP